MSIYSENSIIIHGSHNTIHCNDSEVVLRLLAVIERQAATIAALQSELSRMIEQHPKIG